MCYIVSFLYCYIVYIVSYFFFSSIFVVIDRDEQKNSARFEKIESVLRSGAEMRKNHWLALFKPMISTFWMRTDSRTELSIFPNEPNRSWPNVRLGSSRTHLVEYNTKNLCIFNSLESTDPVNNGEWSESVTDWISIQTVNFSFR